MRWQAQAPLRSRNTFGVDATARWLLEIDHADALPEALTDPRCASGLLVLGGGSNLLFAGEPTGVLLRMRCDQVTLLDEDAARVRVRAQAGADWHGFVCAMLKAGLHGVENLSLIPGTVGAAPIQNIGAYGVEVDEVVHAVHAWDRQASRAVVLDNAACGFAYRDSVFKRQPDRWIVTAVDFTLSRQFTPRLAYAGLGEELQQRGIVQPTAQAVSDAVIAIRRRKLPDPAVVGNAGSFFKNPLIDAATADALRTTHPRLPVFATDDAAMRKLSAAWLIDQCGFKGAREGDAGVSPDHALVLVNHGQATGLQLLALARRIAAGVQARFGVALEPEPRLIGATW